MACKSASIVLMQLVGAPARTLRRLLGAEYLLVGALSWAVALPIGLLCIRAAVRATGTLSGVLPDPRVPVGQIVLTLPLTMAAAFLAVWIPSRRLLVADVMGALRYE